jgi:hypothetical protein
VQIVVVAGMIGGGIGAIARWVGRFLDRLLDRTIAAADAQHAQMRADNAALRRSIEDLQGELGELRLEVYTLHVHFGIVRRPPPTPPAVPVLPALPPGSGTGSTG